MRGKIILAFILGGLIFGTTGVIAATVLASNITYDNTNSGINANNVQDAIDSLYTKANNPTIPANYKELSTTTTATASDIISGKTAYNNLGELITGTSNSGCIKGSFIGTSALNSSNGYIIENDFSPSFFIVVVSNIQIIYYNSLYDSNNWYNFSQGNNWAVPIPLNDYMSIDNNSLRAHDWGANTTGLTHYWIACK